MTDDDDDLLELQRERARHRGTMALLAEAHDVVTGQLYAPGEEQQRALNLLADIAKWRQRLYGAAVLMLWGAAWTAAWAQL